MISRCRSKVVLQQLKNIIITHHIRYVFVIIVIANILGTLSIGYVYISRRQSFHQHDPTRGQRVANDRARV